jgi:hypothetical protein
MTLMTASNNAESSSHVCSIERRAGASTVEMIEDILVELKSVPLDLAPKCAVVSPSLTIACCIERVIANYGRSSSDAAHTVKKLHGMMHLNEAKMTGCSFSRQAARRRRRSARVPASFGQQLFRAFRDKRAVRIAQVCGRYRGAPDCVEQTE